MAQITRVSRLVAGVDRGVDLSTNTVVVGDLLVGGLSGTSLTKAILDRLVTLQNGSDVDTTYHTHDTVYTRTTALTSTTGGSAGSTVIGDNNSYSHFTPTAATVKGALSGIDTALASITTPLDGTFRIENTSDPTKKIAFDASAITTGTTRTISMPDSNVNLGLVGTAIQKDGSVTYTANQPMGSHKLTGLSAGTTAGDSVRYEQAILASGANAFAADQSMGGFKLTNLADPVSGTDAVNVNYLSARLNGLKPKQSVRAATTTAGTLASSFANGSVIDGVTLATGDRILLKDQSSAAENGIYVVAASGAPSRAADFDSLSPIDEINGAWVAVQEGTASAGKVFVQYGTVATLNTDPINFEYFNPIASLIGGDMITFSGSTFSVDLATASGLESTNPGNASGQLRIKLEASNPSLKFTGSNELAVKLDPAGAITSGASGLIVGVDNSTLEINSNALRVKDAGITLAKLASNSVDENKIVSTSFSATGAVTGGSGSKIAVQVDGSTIEINTNALRVKDAGITAAKLASGVFDQVTITGGTGSAAVVQSAPLVNKVLVAGESFAANTTFCVRWGMNSNSETTDRVYKADYDTTSLDKFWVIGVASSTGAVTAGQNITVTMLGSYTLGSSDTAFSAGDVGNPVWLTSAGAFSTTAPTTALQAAFKVGIVESTSKIWVDRQMMGVN